MNMNKIQSTEKSVNSKNFGHAEKAPFSCITTEFGKITIDGKTYNQDILIDVNGKLIARTDISMRYYGHAQKSEISGMPKMHHIFEHHHTICREEVKELIEEQKPDYLIIGTGQYGACKLEESIPKICERNNIKIIIMKNAKHFCDAKNSPLFFSMKKTPEAIKEFNSLSGKKIGVFHITC